MARITKEKLIGDVELQLTQAFPSQDLELEQSQTAFWLTNVRNALVAQEIEKSFKQGKQVPQIYLVTETCKQLVETPVGCVDSGEDGENDNYYFALTGAVVDVSDDNGIVQVLSADDDGDQDEIFKASLQSLPMLKAMTYTKPSSQIVSWSRSGDYIYVQGFKNSDIDFNKIIVTYVAKQDLLTMADTDLVNITDSLLPVLIEQVVELGKLELFGTQADTENNASPDIKSVYHRQIESPAQQPTQA